MGPSDEDLVRRYRTGDDAAFEALVDRYSVSAVRFAGHFVRDSHAAEDAAQDAFLRLVTFLRAGNFDPERGRFAPFFFRMLRNLAIDRIRSRGNAAELHQDWAAPRETETMSILESGERRDRVRSLVLRLPENERSAIILREFEGLSYKEIADALETPLDTVKTWIFRARRKIEESWLAMEVDRESL
jgi:RNA polymerase sigma-70 factor (ECF subfamily)